MSYIKIPESVRSIGEMVFYGCSSLESVIIPEGISSISERMFEDCSGLTSVEIPNSVTVIGSYAFMDSGLKSIKFGKSVKEIGESAFHGCSALTKAEFSSIESLCNIQYDNMDGHPFSNAVRGQLYVGGSDIKELVIPDNVTAIGNYAFFNCGGLTDITIPNSVTSIGEMAFSGCYSLSSIIIPNSVTTIGSEVFVGCPLKSLTIPESVTSIGNWQLWNCPYITDVIINSNYIASKTYTDSDNLSTIFGKDSGSLSYTFGGNVESIGNYALYNDKQIVSLTIGERVSSIANNAFGDNDNLQTITINSNIIASKDYSPTLTIRDLFGSHIVSCMFGNSVEKIGSYACYKCGYIRIGDNVVSIGDNAIRSTSECFANRGTKGLITLWNYGMDAYQLERPSLKINTTQMKVIVRVENFYSELTNKLSGGDLGKEDEYIITLKPQQTYIVESKPEQAGCFTLEVSKDGLVYSTSQSYTTQSISPTVERIQGTASSMVAKASYLEGDAEVTSQVLTINGVTIEGDSLYLTGLNPGTSYEALYTIKVNAEYEYTGTVDLKTDALTFQNEQPKVISEGNIVVASQSNLDDEETNVGFEWRRTDWTDDFASNSGKAYLYEGMMEGYIRNLNSSYLWKFRPYYTADDGTTSYGDWQGIDPTNTSYFEPTVHTYAKLVIDGNTAEVRGYAQRGTDNVTSQGFLYWKTTSPQTSPKAREMKAPSIPSDAKKVEANGTVMEACLTGLAYSTTYSYVAYVMTSEGETFYGEEQSFTTEDSPTGIGDINESETFCNGNENNIIYDLSGRRLSRMQKGINIIRGANGTIIKLLTR